VHTAHCTAVSDVIWWEGGRGLLQRGIHRLDVVAATEVRVCNAGSLTKITRRPSTVCSDVCSQ